MRVVFFGTPAFAVPTLEALLAARHDVVGVITQPDKPRGRGQRVSDAPVKVLALDRRLAVMQPPRLTRETIEEPLRQLAPDLGVVAAYGKILPEWLLQLPARGMINVHASLLPKYRGAAPVHRAVINGETETGVTIMRVVKALDAGPMLASVVRPIGLLESSDVVERDLALLGAPLLADVVARLEGGEVNEVPQVDGDASYAARLTKEEGLLDFTLPALAVHNRIRGLRPWPGAYTFLDSTRIVFHQSAPSPDAANAAAPGTCIAASADGIVVACGDGQAVNILQVQPEGRRAMTPREYLAGHRGLTGRRFGR